MDRNTMMAMVASILSTLNEEDGWCPASMIYLLAGSDLAAYEAIIGRLVEAGWVTRTAETITITDAGREIARKIDAAMPHAA